MKNKISKNRFCIRTVLVEKKTPIIDDAIKYFCTNNFKIENTDIIPIGNNKILVYQENKEESSIIFNENTIDFISVEIVIARCIILNEKMHDYVFLKNCDFYFYDRKDSAGLFFYTNNISWTSLIAIPVSARNKFVELCILTEKNKNNNTVSNFIHMEQIPVFKIPNRAFHTTSLISGEFMAQIAFRYSNIEKKYLQKEEDIRLFIIYCKIYNIGKWNEANKNLMLNEILNYHNFRSDKPLLNTISSLNRDFLRDKRYSNNNFIF